jgi:hypothetical protein
VLEVNRSVEEDGVDADELLKYREPERDGEPQSNSRNGHQWCSGSLLALVDVAGDSLQLGVDRLGFHELLQHRASLLQAIPHDEPSRTAGHEDEADEQEETRDRAKSEHPSPSVAEPDEDRVHDVGGEDAQHDGQLEEADSTTPRCRRRGFTDVEGADHARQSDTHADHDSADDEPEGIRDECEKDGSHAEDDAGHHVRETPSIPVGHPAAGRGAEDGADEHARGDQLGEKIRDPELLPDGEERAGDDSDVVSEEESTDGGHEPHAERDEERRADSRFWHLWFPFGLTGREENQTCDR